MLLELIISTILVIAMIVMWKEMKYAEYKVSTIPSIVLVIFQLFAILGGCVGKWSYLLELKSKDIFVTIGFLILVEIAFIFILIQYIKYKKVNKK